MEVASDNHEGLGERAQDAFSDLIQAVLASVEAVFRQAVARGEFSGDPELAAAQLVAMVRGLVVLERAAVEEARLRDIASHTIDTILA